MWGDCICLYSIITCINTLRPRQNGSHFPDDIFKCIFLNENVRILLNILLKFVPKVWINNIQPLVQIMAWCWPGDKPLSEPMMVNLLTHINITRIQWVNPERVMISHKILWDIWNSSNKRFELNYFANPEVIPLKKSIDKRLRWYPSRKSKKITMLQIYPILQYILSYDQNIWL